MAGENITEPIDTDVASGTSEDNEDLRAEVERLRAENEKLASVAAPHTFWRNGGRRAADQASSSPRQGSQSILTGHSSLWTQATTESST